MMRGADVFPDCAGKYQKNMFELKFGFTVINPE